MALDRHAAGLVLPPICSFGEVAAHLVAALLDLLLLMLLLTLLDLPSRSLLLHIEPLEAVLCLLTLPFDHGAALMVLPAIGRDVKREAGRPQSALPLNAAALGRSCLRCMRPVIALPLVTLAGLPRPRRSLALRRLSAVRARLRLVSSRQLRGIATRDHLSLQAFGAGNGSGASLIRCFGAFSHGTALQASSRLEGRL
jgi:hypothetical protein